ncbi:tRNA dihydrouridine synthase [Calycomorphotria hydatis]|uniref:tRNA-dihydrouridine synthase n=1 Tax=Calycomorphotria hydatis TaxID=2528027 RepID=A0A517TC24_9PLAN|nr:tRNA-dihydrouridine synthase [Calycomorphotria hydatis]QDT65922.1 tRNA-dihydrouridine synthase C [Calycomorphotria hydatis]
MAESETISKATERDTITIGGRQLNSRYFLAPLAGYTHLAFRTVIREVGGVGLCTTDLVHAGHLLARSRKSRELLATSPADNPLTVQIFGRDHAQICDAARWLEDNGYAAVDLNMGCPMRRVNGSGGGAKMMCDVGGATALVRKVIAAVSIPVSVKMRLGWDTDNQTAPELARAFEQEGVCAVTVHGRTREQGFNGSVNLDGIAATVDAVNGMPIVGNGDVRTPQDAIKMRKLTGCDAVAVGRGALMDPWIFRKLEQINNGQSPIEPTPEEIIHFLDRHFTLMTDQHGELACLQFRKFAAWYGAKLGIPEDLEQRLRQIESIESFGEILAEIKERHGERETSIPTALIKTPNGPNEVW